jgi:hypothetical protein
MKVDTDSFINIDGVEGEKIYIVAIYLMNNETSPNSDAVLDIFEKTPYVRLYGSEDASVYLRGNGASWGFPLTRDSLNYPYFICSEGKDFHISMSFMRVAGLIIYYQE